MADRPGVLAAIAGVFGTHEVSIQSMQQQGQGDDARLIFVTHLAREADLRGDDPRGRASSTPVHARRLGAARRRGRRVSTTAPRWPGLIEAYREHLPVTDATPVVTLLEGNTPLLEAPRLVGAGRRRRVYLKVEGANPTGSFKDRGMTHRDLEGGRERRQGRGVRVDRQHVGVGRGLRGARRAHRARSSSPTATSRSGKLAQALIHGARVVPIRGNFDDALDIVRELGERPRRRRSSTRSTRSASKGRRPPRSRSCDALGDAPDVHCIPVGNAGNITAYWKGYAEYARRRSRHAHAAHARVAGRGRGAARARRAGAAPRDDRHRDPDREPGVVGRRDRRRATSRAAHIGAVTDAEILEAYRMLAVDEGVFVEPASAASVAGLLQARGRRSRRRATTSSVCTVTGHGLKDPNRAIAEVQVGDPVDATARPSRARSTWT